jgi:hypothetical protein
MYSFKSPLKGEGIVMKIERKKSPVSKEMIILVIISTYYYI